MSTNNAVFLCCGVIGCVLLDMVQLFWPSNFWTSGDPHNWMILVSLILGSILLLIACTFYALGKGYKWWLGLLGLIAPVGIVVLAALEEKRQAE